MTFKLKALGGCRNHPLQGAGGYCGDHTADRTACFSAQTKQALWEAATTFPLPCKLTFDSLILKMPILVFLGLSVLEISPMYASDVRQTDRRQTSDIRQTKTSLNASALWERRHNSMNAHYTNLR